jgi:hypothetical protein
MKSQILQKTKENKPSKEVRKLIDEANQFAVKAEVKIKEAYAHATKVDKLEPEAAKRMLYDNLRYSPQWIRKFIPDEAIMKSKGRTASNLRRGIARKQKIIGTMLKTHRATVTTEVEVITVPAEKFKQFLSGLIEIQEKANKYGVQIHKDLTVELISS